MVAAAVATAAASADNDDDNNDFVTVNYIKTVNHIKTDVRKVYLIINEINRCIIKQ